ncbi:MAG: TetR/AcrR family transcriptional regulator [Coriobacteriia bacterium]|nr:TetR/AcrR family transcriptional regulator [Coriobacteriia bacterium]MBN2823161.1 TetR/AcrR family transcriptional regulator [Coriobacteriia bacterium]
MDPDERREQILSVASAHFAREGYEDVSVRAIASDAGVTRALVYHYFPGKESLLTTVLRRETQMLLDVTEPDPLLSRQDNLQRAVSVYLEHFSQSSGALRDLIAPRAMAPLLVHELAAYNHAVQVERVLSYLGQEDTPVTRLAIGAWLGFVVEAARESARNPAVPADEITRLCINSLHAITGSVLDLD